MLRVIHTVNIGGRGYEIALDESTSFFKSDEITYLFMPPKIIPTCLYLYLKQPGGFVYEPPIKIKLVLTGNLSHIDESEVVFYGEIQYYKHQLLECNYKFNITRAGYYDIYISDIKIDKWERIAQKIFFMGVVEHNCVEFIGPGDVPAIIGEKTKVTFSLYNINSDVSRMEIDSLNHILLGSGYEVDLQAQCVSFASTNKIIIDRNINLLPNDKVVVFEANTDGNNGEYSVVEVDSLGTTLIVDSADITTDGTAGRVEYSTKKRYYIYIEVSSNCTRGVYSAEFELKDGSTYLAYFYVK